MPARMPRRRAGDWPFSDLDSGRATPTLLAAAEAHLEADGRLAAVGRHRELEGAGGVDHALLGLARAQGRAHDLAQGHAPAPVDGELEAHAAAQRRVAGMLALVAGAQRARLGADDLGGVGLREAP